MAFIEELRQRKVVRVAVAYLVVAWLGVQVASIALPAFDAPAWVLPVLILFPALGFPLALILTWAIDLTPDGPRYSPGGVGMKRMLAISIGLGALAPGWYFLGQPAFRDNAPDASRVAATTPTPAASAAKVPYPRDQRSIAVLPFVNMSHYAGNSSETEKEKRRRYAAEALRLNPSMGEAYAARAGLYDDEKNLAAADESHRRAIELAPNFATAYQWYAEFLQRELRVAAAVWSTGRSRGLC